MSGSNKNQKPITQRQAFVESVLDTIESLVVVLDDSGKIQLFNRACESLSGYSFEEVHNRRVWDFLLLPEESKDVEEVFNQLRCGDFPNSHMNSWVSRSGEVRRIQWFNSALANGNGKIEYIIATGIDVTDRIAAEAKVEHQAYHDGLTDLPNRQLLYDRLNRELSRSLRKGHIGAILFIDLDNFKPINDTLGHHVGDRVIQHVAKILRSNIREEDTAARLGGDEFVVLLPEVGDDVETSAKTVQKIARHLIEKLCSSFNIDENSLGLTASIGVSLFPLHGDTVEDIIMQADTAMYRAKDRGKNTFEFYDPSMQAAAAERMKLDSQLRRSVSDQQLELYFQPQVDSSGRVMGAESLLRWNHPDEGMLLPAKFILLAEDSGLMPDIGDWVLRAACSQLKAWNDFETPLVMGSMAVNISAMQFHQNDFVSRVIDTIEQYGVDPGQIELELTESMFMGRVNEALDKMHALNDYGIHLSIDDFGTGCSSLSYLKTLPVDRLKIDRSFIRDLSISKKDAAIVDTIISMCHHMDINVLAEGVESELEKDYLEERGCNLFQGYYFHKPMPASRFYKTFIH